jgi:hypothetical protein
MEQRSLGAMNVVPGFFSFPLVHADETGNEVMWAG